MSSDMKKFWKSILSSKDTHSSKRLVTLIIAAHFILAGFLILFFAFFMIVHVTKGTVNPDLINLLKIVIDDDFYIILAGLGFITADNLAQMLIERAKALASGIANTVSSATSSITSDPSGSTATTTVTNKPDTPQTEEGA